MISVNLGNFLGVMNAQLLNLRKCDNPMMNYHCIDVGCNYNDSRKSNKLTKYPHKISDESGCGYTVPLTHLRSNCLADSSAKLHFPSNFCLKASLAKFNDSFYRYPDTRIPRSIKKFFNSGKDICIKNASSSLCLQTLPKSRVIFATSDVEEF